MYALHQTLLNQIRGMRWEVHMACMGERRGAYRFLVEKPDGTSTLGRLRHRWIILKLIFMKQFGGHGLD